MAHCKGMLNDIFNANLMRLKLAFEALREELDKKEEEILEEYESKVVCKFNDIDAEMAESRRRIELCRSHLEWLDGNLVASDNCSSTAQMYEIVNYYIASHTAIE